MLLGNKTDLAEEGRRQVTFRQGQKLAEVINRTDTFTYIILFLLFLISCANLCVFQEYTAEYVECSAKSGYNIQRAMTHLAR